METFLGTPQLPSREQVAGLDLDCCFQIHEPPQVGLGSQAPPTPILAPLGGLAGKWLRYTCQLQNWVTDTSLTKICWRNCICIHQKKFPSDRLHTFNRRANILAGWVCKNTLNWARDYVSSRLDLRVHGKDADRGGP